MREMIKAGFQVDAFLEVEANDKITYSASIYAHNP